MMVLKDNYNTLPVYYLKYIVIKKEKTGILPMEPKFTPVQLPLQLPWETMAIFT